MDAAQPVRDFIFFFDTALTPFYDEFKYNTLDEDIRYVPPHPDDDGAMTSPVTSVDPESGDEQGIAYYGFEWDLNFNFLFYERFFFKYTFGIGTVFDDRSAQTTGRYQYPPRPRQHYDSGENAFTFITINTQPIFTNYLSIGYFAAINDKPFPFEHGVFSFEAGVALRTYMLMRGWDRYAKVEALDTIPVNVWGGFLFVQYQKHFYLPNTDHAYYTLGIGVKMIASPDTLVFLLDFPIPVGFSS